MKIKKGAWHCQKPLGRPSCSKTFTYCSQWDENLIHTFWSWLLSSGRPRGFWQCQVPFLMHFYFRNLVLLNLTPIYQNCLQCHPSYFKVQIWLHLVRIVHYFTPPTSKSLSDSYISKLSTISPLILQSSKVVTKKLSPPYLFLIWNRFILKSFKIEKWLQINHTDPRTNLII